MTAVREELTAAEIAEKALAYYVKAGIALTEASMQEYLDSLGMAHIRMANLSEAQKAQVRYAVMVNSAMNQGIVGTYAREMHTAEGAVRTLSQQMKTLGQAIGSIFIPILSAVIPWISAFVSVLYDAIAAVAAFFNIPFFEIAWGDSTKGMSGGLGEVADAADNASSALGGAGAAAKKLKDYKSIFKLPYEQGELRVEALDEVGRVISTHSLFSGDDVVKLSAIPEKSELSVGELCYIPIEFVDGKGLLRPEIEQRVDVSVEGGKLLGLGSALYKTDDAFGNSFYNSYRGRCLAVVKATEVGSINISINSAGVTPAYINLEVK